MFKINEDTSFKILKDGRIDIGTHIIKFRSVFVNLHRMDIIPAGTCVGVASEIVKKKKEKEVENVEQDNRPE